METVTEESKPGYLTTEFWLSVLTGAYMVLNTTGALDQIPAKWSGIATAIIAAAYALSRGQAKQGVPFTRVERKVR